jgi:hypothetical protein
MRLGGPAFAARDGGELVLHLVQCQDEGACAAGVHVHGIDERLTAGGR